MRSTTIAGALVNRHNEDVAALTAQLEAAQRDHDEQMAWWREQRDIWNTVLAEAEAEAAALREALAKALSLAKVATNTWACVARSKRDFDVIGGLHRDIDAMRDKWALGGQPPTKPPKPEHVCGLRGFAEAALEHGDRCPACEASGRYLGVQPPTGGQ